MPILSGCCFCFDLKVGSKIIGILNLIGGIINTILWAILLVAILIFGNVDDIAKEFNKQNDPDGTTLNPAVEDDYADVTQEEKNFLEQILNFAGAHIDTAKIFLYVMLALSFLMIITASMLLHGIRRNRRGLLIPFMIQLVVVLLFYAACGIGMLVLVGTHIIIIGCAVSVLFSFLMTLYFLLVIISQYQALGLIRMHEEISMK